MPPPDSSLRLLDRTAGSIETDLVSELFHRINRIIPEDQSLLVVSPASTVRETVGLMLRHGYSQVPVVDHGDVLGVFSLRSFAQGAVGATLDDWTKQRCAPGDLSVDEFLEPFEFARVTEEISRVFDSMDRDGGILIGTPEQLVGILTPVDFLHYLHRVASPFVMVSEIELALRALIRIVLPGQQLLELARRILASVYGNEERVPDSLEEMTFDNYQSLLAHKDSWIYFEPVFGGTRARASAKLKEVGSIRNDLFHFKREITFQDQETLAVYRNWLLNKVKQANASEKEGAEA